MKKRGRKPSINPKCCIYIFGMTKNEYENLRGLSLLKGKTMASIIRQGINLVTNLEGLD